jgi:hypothetical protein
VALITSDFAKVLVTDRTKESTMTALCQQCRRRRPRHETLAGRRLCQDCFRDLAAYAGAGSAIVSGGGAGEALVTGMATRAYAGAFTGEARAARARRAKLDATQGRWRRLWVRVVG